MRVWDVTAQACSTRVVLLIRAHRAIRCAHAERAGDAHRTRRGSTMPQLTPLERLHALAAEDDDVYAAMHELATCDVDPRRETAIAARLYSAIVGRHATSDELRALAFGLGVARYRRERDEARE